MKRFRVLPAAALALAAGTLVSCSSSELRSSELSPSPALTDVSPTASPSSQESDPGFQQYVALGDSYAAMGSAQAPTTGASECFRSDDNYPNHVAADDRIEEFIDVSCASGVTTDILNPRETSAEVLPPQIDSLTKDTDLVTISIGGNDIGFPSLAGCFQAAYTARTESDCASQFDRKAGMNTLNASLFEVYQAVSERAPEAEVYVTGYLPLISPEGECAGASFISDADRGWAVGLTNELNGRIEGMATEMGFTFILPDDAIEHTVCAAPEDRWTDLSGVLTGAYPMHPTALGQQAMADSIIARL